ncbi:multidrug transporter MatE [Brachyspira hyodysenteriae]|uniref:Multidrug export protein MepA n=1 Tax=Brachyspira hyodysenteriae ATCC 27164 TaxID=1266923 RepID=A0A3B6VSN3_BRAHO|nr:MATE family efflux transporter [Brachyspira hyodysenteriae]ANN63693.1 MATE family efflux transporter [Brachyspira hyodysenteriae ATCC 27164]KLI19567.1 multidrug transporter MatE [Brachyspira hyodysenteriae]KLI28244.1 multidrug transporter MatE [Brachyspira hyodysenteriae]MCZ9925206.1 MATE family efflux transporter [Brachyspira hyodysenteriae]TVL62247.1 MATE family efflux transporter [Brachyspira hyodysenteriae]
MNNDVVSNPLYYEKPYKLLFKYATPSIISMLVGSLYNIVDQIFIGQGIGINGNAATNVAFPLTIICMSIALFHGFGSASMYSILLGQGNNKRAATFIGNAVVSALALGFIFTLIVKLFNKNFMVMFGSTKEVLPYAIEYTNITAFGFIPFIFSTMMSHIIRADGSPKYSMMSVLTGAIVNTILDPVLIFKFDMGISGAALATIIGQFISFAIVFRYLFRFKHITFEKDNFKVDPKNILKIFSLGSSSGFNQLAMMAVQITMNNVLSYYGTNSIYGGNIPLAVAGIISKVNMLVMAFIIGTSQGSQPIIGFNYGAQNYDRVIKTYKLTITITTIMAFIAFLLFQLFPRQIVGIFGDGSELYFHFAEEYMRIYMALMVINGIQPVTGTFFTSLGKAFKGAFISMTRQIIFLLPLIIILPRILGIDGVMYAGPVADGAALIVTVILVSREIKKLKILEKNKSN